MDVSAKTEMGYSRQYSDWGEGEPTEGMYHSSIVLGGQLHLGPTQPTIHCVKWVLSLGVAAEKLTNDF